MGTARVLAQYGKKSEGKGKPKKLKYTDTKKNVFVESS